MLRYTIAFTIPFIIVEWTGAAYLDKVTDNQTDFVDMLYAYDDISSEVVRKVFLQVHRKKYKYKTPYEDYPKVKPYEGDNRPLNMQAYAMKILEKKLIKGNRAMDVACGSGYLTALMKLMVGKEGFVVGVLSTKKEAINARKNVLTNNPKLLEKTRLRFLVRVLEEGIKRHGPYDAIHVGQEYDEAPEALLTQLKKGGRMLIPISSPTGYKMFRYDMLYNGTVINRLLETFLYDKYAKPIEVCKACNRSLPHEPKKS